MEYANEFNEILPSLTDNSELKQKVVELIKTRPIPGKSIEEDIRVNRFRGILVELIKGDISSLEESYAKIESEIPRSESRYSSNNHVFSRGWSERLVRTQLTRFYNQAILEKLKNSGENECFVPASSSRNFSSECAIIQNKNYKVDELLQNLIKFYENGQFDRVDRSIKIPEHPHCSHVVKPKNNTSTV
jgi:hypothetical protein